MPEDYEYDVFNCHATEDKDEIARPLADILTSKKLHVWYDEFTLRMGDSLRGKIDHGLSSSKYGVVILSPSFFGKDWTAKELGGLVAREDGKHKVILPVWHHVKKEDVAKYSPILADRVAASSEDGLDVVVRKIWEVMSSQPTIFEKMVDLDAHRRLLKFSLGELADELSGCLEAHKGFFGKEPTGEEIENARRLLDLEPAVDTMDIHTIDVHLEEVRESIGAIDKLWDIASQAMEWEGTHQ